MTPIGEQYASGPDLWYWENAALLPEEWSDCEKRSLRLPFGCSSPDVALDEHQRAILAQVFLYGADGASLNLTAARERPVLHGTGRPTRKGDAPHTPPLPGSGRGGGGNAPPVLAPAGARSKAAAMASVTQRAQQLDWPKDEFGCYIIPQYFNLEGYTFAQ